MIEKVYALVKGTIMPENPDSIMNHEILLPSNVLSPILSNELTNILRKSKLMYKISYIFLQFQVQVRF